MEQHCDSRPQLAGASLLKTGAGYIHKQSIFEPWGAAERNVLRLFALMHRLARAMRRFVPSINPLRAPHTPQLRLIAFVGSSRLSGPLERPAFASYFAR